MPAGVLGGRVNADEKTDSCRADVGHLAEIDQDFLAVRSPDFIFFGVQVLMIRCNETPFAAHKANFVFLTDLDEHQLTKGSSI